MKPAEPEVRLFEPGDVVTFDFFHDMGKLHCTVKAKRLGVEKEWVQPWPEDVTNKEGLTWLGLAVVPQLMKEIAAETKDRPMGTKPRLRVL